MSAYLVTADTTGCRNVRCSNTAPLVESRDRARELLLVLSARPLLLAFQHSA